MQHSFKNDLSIINRLSLLHYLLVVKRLVLTVLMVCKLMSKKGAMDSRSGVHLQRRPMMDSLEAALVSEDQLGSTLWGA
jgi:hypothetical protein